MYSDHFWLCLEGLAMALDGRRHDDLLAPYEQVFLKWTKSKQAEIRAQLASAVNALTQLEMRLSVIEESRVDN